MGLFILSSIINNTDLVLTKLRYQRNLKSSLKFISIGGLSCWQGWKNFELMIIYDFLHKNNNIIFSQCDWGGPAKYEIRFKFYIGEFSCLQGYQTLTSVKNSGCSTLLCAPPTKKLFSTPLFCTSFTSYSVTYIHMS